MRLRVFASANPLRLHHTLAPRPTVQVSGQSRIQKSAMPCNNGLRNISLQMKDSTSTNYETFNCFTVKRGNGVAKVSLNHPPLNLLDGEMSTEFASLAEALESDRTIRVVVFESSLPGFFIAHSGLARVTSGKQHVSATRTFRLTQLIGERIRNMPKVTIAKVEGICRGGGNEIAMACDMCFAATGRALFGQPEVALGLVPGGGATQRLPRLIGRGRALEVLLTGEDFSATDAERMGFINRALAPEKLEGYVDHLCSIIAKLPENAVASIKQSVDAGVFGSLSEGLLVEAQQSDKCASSERTQKRVREALTLGMETVEGETNLAKILAKLV